MANGFIVIDDKEWEHADAEARSWMTYKTLKAIDGRLQVLEKRPLMDKCFSFLGGAIGGFAAALGIKWGA